MADKLELDSNERDLLDHCIVEMENDTGLDRNAALARNALRIHRKSSRELGRQMP